MGAPARTAAVGEGHRGLLDTLREFAGAAEAPGGLDPAGLRATVAFLRQSVLPFARWEEGQPGGCEQVAEDIAFEHAFLAAEIDRLGAAVAALERGTSRDRAVCAAAALRQVHRIEAVLELHVHKAEEHDTLFSPTPTSTPVPDLPAAASSAVRAMTPAEVQAFLREREWGLLSTLGETGPYAVPVSYGVDRRGLYLASAPGRKRGNLEARPGACLTVVEVASGDRWRSVVASGEARMVDDLRGKIRALAAIHRQRGAGAPSATDLARAARATVFRLVPTELSGRVRG